MIRYSVCVNMKSLVCKIPNYILCEWARFNYHIHLRCFESKVSHPEGKARQLKHLPYTPHIQTTSTSDTMSP